MARFRKVIRAAALLAFGTLAFTPSASAQNTHAVVDLQENCLIGGSSGGRWVEADEIAPLLKGGERYRLYTLEGARGRAVGSDTASGDANCDGAKMVKLSRKVEKGVAVGGPWNAMPRVPKMLSTKDPASRRVVARLLARKGFRRPVINVTQVLRVDLDGDGVEEALISATHLAEGLSTGGGPMAVHARPGDYSLVVLRKIVRGRVRDIILTEGYFPRPNSEQWTPTQDEVAAIVDINGDGRMEIILHGGYYEGSWATVFALKGNGVENLFGCGCGA
jgi:hypothetical protein